jgi:DNA-binding transcriptional ArsR family regulator
MTADALSATFAALSDPTRRAILARLASGEASVTELAGPFKISQPAVSKHLKVLERAGLIARSRNAQWRPCRLEARPLREAALWVEQYRRFWEARFERLDAYLAELQGKEKADAQARESGRQQSETGEPSEGRIAHRAVRRPRRNARVRRPRGHGLEGLDRA